MKLGDSAQIKVSLAQLLDTLPYHQHIIIWARSNGANLYSGYVCNFLGDLREALSADPNSYLYADVACIETIESSILILVNYVAEK